MAGGSMSMTGITIWLIWLLQGNPFYLFSIAMGALILIGLQQTGFVAILAKRSITLNKENIIIQDKE